MASAWTTTDSLADSLPTLLMSARTVREYEQVMPQLVERQTLGEGVGLDWNEITLEKLEAQSVTETTELDNPQEITDTIFTITPTMVGIHTFITDLVAKRISKNVFAKTGGLAQNAIERKKDEDGLTVLDGATNSEPGTGETLTSGHIGAMVAYIRGNSTERGKPPFRCVLHSYQAHDIEDEIIAGLGTYPIGDGLTARVFTEGYRGMVNGAQIYIDDNIDISSGDAKGGVFAGDAIVLVQGFAPRAAVVRNEKRGGGGTDVYHYDQYAYGERRAGYWLYEVYSDATAPTS